MRTGTDADKHTEGVVADAASAGGGAGARVGAGQQHGLVPEGCPEEGAVGVDVGAASARLQGRRTLEKLAAQSVYSLACAELGVVPKRRVQALLGTSPSLIVDGLLLGPGIVAVAQAISYGLGAHSRSLTELDVSGNKIDDAVMAPLAQTLSRCRLL